MAQLLKPLKPAATKLYAWLETHWFGHIICAGSPVCRLLDVTVISRCTYCSSVRGIVLGAGAAMALCGWPITGTALIAITLLMTFLENFVME
jgi:hypothetical protein